MSSSTWPKIRKFFNDIHLWGGLISGIIVLVVCATGTVYTYNTELREAAIPHYYRIKPEGTKLNVDTLLAHAKSDIKGKLVGVKVPFASDKTTFALYAKPKKEEEGKENSGEKETTEAKKQDAKALAVKEGQGNKSEEGKKELGADGGKAKPAPTGGGRGPRANQMALNPYTGQVIGDPSDEKTKTAAVMQTMFGLHRWLLLNEVENPIVEGVENRKLGSWITGSATILFLIGVISGMIIWFPVKMRGWKNGLKIKWSARWKRINHDLHNTLGFYSCIILFLMAVTGPFWSFEWYRAGWQKTWGTYKSPDAPKEEKPKLISAIPTDGSKPLSIEETILVVNKLLPYDGDITIYFAKDSTGTISISKNRIGFFAPSAGDKLTLDQYTGEALEKDVFRDKPFNERAAASIKALHIGDIYGPFSKLLYFISCLIATSLPVTGTIVWINKMKKKKK
ncbi:MULTISPECIES: PepSY-associated TM helix domain-containing protein [Sphingobacterium]|uniref:PepSY-associated TM helix domain-containing protein n=1 Tax=Sphingobacterium TaxID=28453 RepID=UPI0013DAC3D7|nr:MULTISPECIES: PepSY-associated TM helix domain-containing protein [unclassified Sphingobacterium]